MGSAPIITKQEVILESVRKSFSRVALVGSVAYRQVAAWTGGIGHGSAVAGRRCDARDAAL